MGRRVGREKREDLRMKKMGEEGYLRERRKAERGGLKE